MIECPADEFIPLPTSAKQPELGYAELRRKAQAACITALVMNSEGYEAPAPNIKNLRSVTGAAMKTASHGLSIPNEQARAMLKTPEGALFVNEILTRYDMEVVKDAKRIRNFVTNKLIVESENMDSRIRMRALELLGKISDVGLFTERTEITVNNRSTTELENSLRDKLRRLMQTDAVEDANILEPNAIKTPVITDSTAHEALAGF